MKHFMSLVLYHAGDIISKTTMVWINGFGYAVYRQLMLWSCDLDAEGRVWKYVKQSKRKKRK